jgi:hypothetical protein
MLKGDLIMYDPAADNTTVSNRICEVGMIVLAVSPIVGWIAMFFSH